MPKTKLLSTSMLTTHLLFAGMLIAGLLIAGCQSPTSPPLPTQIPTPTSTPDPYVEWTEFIDPWGRFSVRYPPEWQLYPAASQEVGYATTISSVSMGTTEEPAVEFNPPQDGFAIWFTFDLGGGTVVPDLMSWAEDRLHPGGVVLQRDQATIAGVSAVVEIFEHNSGQQAKIVHFMTPNGVLSVIGQPWGNPHSDSFDLLLSTIAFQ
jgi:hypothetical protein